MRRVVALVFVLVLASTNAFAQVTNSKLTGQNFQGEVTVNAGPQAVWAILTDVEKLSNILQFDYKGGMKKLEKAGDSATLQLWGDTGTYILIYVKPMRELRMVWEPDNATYLCQERWLLSPKGKGTVVSYQERYTESGPQTAEAIADQVKSYNAALGRLQAMLANK